MHEATFQEELFDLSGTGNASTGIADFAHWLQSTQLAHGEDTNRMDASVRVTDPAWPTPHKGIMSRRFYEILAEYRSKTSGDDAMTNVQPLTAAVPAFASAPSKRPCSGGGLLTCAGDVKYKGMNLTVDARLGHSDWHNNVDCWVVHGALSVLPSPPQTQ